MDIVAACRAFVSVSDAGSFTLGAIDAQIPQSVASRRVAALEAELGGRLLDRSGRRATLTRFGSTLAPQARRLVQLADTLRRDAVRAQSAPLRLAVPASCPSGDVARLAAAGSASSLTLDLHPADPRERAELLRLRDVDAALEAAIPDEAMWIIPLGLAAARDVGAAPLHVESLRVRRGSRSTAGRRIWIQPEDDVPAVRDPVTRLRDSVGLAPAQVAQATTLTAAVTHALVSDDLLLCSRRQARELGLHWRPIGELDLFRCYALRGTASSDANRLVTVLHEAIGHCLGVEGSSGTTGGTA